MKFNKLNKASRDIIESLYAETDYLGCDYLENYQRAWLSRDEELCCAIEDGIVYKAFCASHLADFCDKELFLPPLTTPDRIATAYARLEEYCHSHSKEFCVIHAPREHIDILGNNYHYIVNTAHSEYIYNSSDLINLPGKKYHAKRNHVARFQREYSYEFRVYQPSDYDGIMALYQSWSDMKDMNDDDCERHALASMLQQYDYYNINVGVLLVAGIIVAFAVGEISANNVGVVHFEKADTSYEGAYAMINWLYSNKYFANVKLVNRQEDMSIEGLRKAKLSYYPSQMCEKWSVISRRK